MDRLMRDGLAEPFMRYLTLRHKLKHGKYNFLYSAEHEQDGQPYPVDSQSTEKFDHTCTEPILFLQVYPR